MKQKKELTLDGDCKIHGKPIGWTQIYVRIRKCSSSSYWYACNVGMLFYLHHVTTDTKGKRRYAVAPTGPFLSGDGGLQWIRGVVPRFSFGAYTGGEQYATPDGRTVDAEDADLIYVQESSQQVARVDAFDGTRYEHDETKKCGMLWEYFKSVEHEAGEP